MEIWKDVLGLEQYYEVSNLGNIKSKVRTGITNFGERTYGGKVVKPFLSTVGYPTVNLTYKGYRKQFHVHKLVLEAFNGNISHEVVDTDLELIKLPESKW